jgi:hypothetical protein
MLHRRVRGVIAVLASAVAIWAANATVAHAQVKQPPPRPGGGSGAGVSIADDSAAPPQHADSIQARMGRDGATPSLEIGQTFTYDREQLFSSGALTLADLLDRIPGFTSFRTGWIAAPQAGAIGGDFSRIRIFIDGAERDDLEARNGIAPDLSTVPLWTLQNLTLARNADGLRVDLRTWEYNGTAPYTRIDALTGDLNTNLYRGFYAKRFYNGAGLQIALQQYGVNDNRNGGGGQDFTGLIRYGIAHRAWSLDATAIRSNDTRTITDRFGIGPDLPGYRAARTLGYLRGAIGHEGSGPFLQIVASTQLLKENSTQYDSLAALSFGFPADTVDTLASSVQYVATAGFDAGGGRLRLIERYRRRSGRGYSSPSATFDLSRKILSVSAMAERDEYAGLTRVEGGARLTPLPFISLLGYVGQRTSFGTPYPGYPVQPSSRSARFEAGVRVLPRGLWISGGVMTRDTAILVPTPQWDTAFVAQPVGRQTATTASIKGPLFGAFTVDLTGTHWQDPAPYTPQDEAHGDIRFYTEWRDRFPDGNFSFLFQPGFDYRSEAPFPQRNGEDRIAAASKTMSLLVEIRILRGVLTYQRRNLLGAIYNEVPGYLMPRSVNVYGVRWYFFN